MRESRETKQEVRGNQVSLKKFTGRHTALICQPLGNYIMHTMDLSG